MFFAFKGTGIYRFLKGKSIFSSYLVGSASELAQSWNRTDTPHWWFRGWHVLCVGRKRTRRTSLCCGQRSRLARPGRTLSTLSPVPSQVGMTLLQSSGPVPAFWWVPVRIWLQKASIVSYYHDFQLFAAVLVGTLMNFFIRNLYIASGRDWRIEYFSGWLYWISMYGC